MGTNIRIEKGLLLWQKYLKSVMKLRDYEIELLNL